MLLIVAEEFFSFSFSCNHCTNPTLSALQFKISPNCFPGGEVASPFELQVDWLHVSILNPFICMEGVHGQMGLKWRIMIYEWDEGERYRWRWKWTFYLRIFEIPEWWLVLVSNVPSIHFPLQEGLFDSSFRHSPIASSIITTFKGVKSQNS